MEMQAVGLALFAAVGMVGLHALICRLFPDLGSVKPFLFAGASVGLPLVIFLVSVLPLEEAIGGLLVYAGLCELYVFLFTLSLASVGSNIVVMLAKGPRKREAIRAEYDDRAMVTTRLRRMVEVGYLHRSGDVISVTPAGQALASRFTRFAAWLGLSATP